MKVKYLLIGILFLSACNGRLDEMRPHNMAEADNYLSSFNNIVNATSGLYGQFQSAAGGYTEVSLYHVAYHVLGEFRANKVIFNDAFLSWSTDYLRGPDAHFFLNSDQKSQSYAWSVWAKSHQLILGASRNIVAIDKLYANTVNPDEKLNLVRLKGENAFLRGLLIFNATNVFGRPFWDQPDKNLGIPLDVEATAQALERSSVRECFEQILKLLPLVCPTSVPIVRLPIRRLLSACCRESTSIWEECLRVLSRTITVWPSVMPIRPSV